MHAAFREGGREAIDKVMRTRSAPPSRSVWSLMTRRRLQRGAGGGAGVTLTGLAPWLAGRGEGGWLGQPLDNLGIRARLALRQHFLYQLDAAL
jgi:hypothetical protein